MKRVLVIFLTVLIFMSCATLGFATVFRVDSVQVNPSTVSEEAKTEANELQALLEEAYRSENTVFAKEDKAKTLVDSFPYFRLIAFKKSYPNRLIVEVAEDAEVYAVEKSENEYYILNAEGTVLGIREHYRNRADTTGKEYNVLLSGFTATGNKGEQLVGTGNYTYLLSVCKKADALLNGIRSNVVSVEIKGGASAETVMIKLKMREGVSLYVENPSALCEEKTEKAILYYMSQDGTGLTDQQRTRGAVIVYETVDGIECAYSDKDMPNE